MFLLRRDYPVSYTMCNILNDAMMKCFHMSCCVMRYYDLSISEINMMKPYASSVRVGDDDDDDL